MAERYVVVQLARGGSSGCSSTYIGVVIPFGTQKVCVADGRLDFAVGP